MSQLPPNLNARSGPPDDLDRLLGRFFKAQVPHPFPPLRSRVRAVESRFIDIDGMRT